MNQTIPAPGKVPTQGDGTGIRKWYAEKKIVSWHCIGCISCHEEHLPGNKTQYYCLHDDPCEGLCTYDGNILDRTARDTPPNEGKIRGRQ